VYDRNLDGLIAKEEMAQVSGNKLSADQIDKCFAVSDTDRDGYLNLTELEEMMRRRREKREKSE
jgi:Ca2+-binding EF-hand superfamily protein